MLKTRREILIPLGFVLLLFGGGTTIHAGLTVQEGLESLGNTDGVLTWQIDQLVPGEEMNRTVLFAYAESRDKLLS
ncbi:MAG: hypothetical protein KC964_18820, partial [Candidatus Omnitrophica bacterium]|nr:hypothetical protein [Candidatus Omnitrophota bacterium]